MHKYRLNVKIRPSYPTFWICSFTICTVGRVSSSRLSLCSHWTNEKSIVKNTTRLLLMESVLYSGKDSVRSMTLNRFNWNWEFQVYHGCLILIRSLGLFPNYYLNTFSIPSGFLNIHEPCQCSNYIGLVSLASFVIW